MVPRIRTIAPPYFFRRRGTDVPPFPASEGGCTQPVAFQRLTAGGRPMWDGIPPARLDAIPLT